MTRSFKLIGAVALAAIVMTGCKSDDNGENGDMQSNQPAMGAVNDTCPVLGKPVTSSGGTTSYGGATVGFCCQGCKGQWDTNMTDAEKQAFVNQNQ